MGKDGGGKDGMVCRQCKAKQRSTCGPLRSHIYPSSSIPQCPPTRMHWLPHPSTTHEKEYCVLAMQTGRPPKPCRVYASSDASACGGKAGLRVRHVAWHSACPAVLPQTQAWGLQVSPSKRQLKKHKLDVMAGYRKAGPPRG